MKTLNNIEEFYNAVEGNEKSIVYFYTEWCPDCYMIKPFVPRLEYDFKDYMFYSFDRDSSIELAKHLEIYGIPSFVVFHNGDEIGRLVTKFRKTYQEVKTFIEKTIK